MRPTPRRLITAGLTALALVVAGCADDSADDTATTGTGSDTPHAIVSLSPTATEMLYAVGAGDLVVAVDDQSNSPPDAPVTNLSGYTPNVEAILGYEPDLVLADSDTGDLVAGLRNAGVDTLLLPAAASLDDTYAQIEQVGAATGHVADAAAVVAQMKTDIDEIVTAVPARETPLRYYHELDDTFYTVTDGTYIGEIYSMLGLTSIATGGDGYPQLSAEFVVEQDPDVVFLADGQCCGVTPEVLASRAGWTELTAIRDGQVHVVDKDLSSRWGPRVVDFAREIAGIVTAIPAGAPAR